MAAATAGVPDCLFKCHAKWKLDNAKDGYTKDSTDRHPGIVSLGIGIQAQSILDIVYMCLYVCISIFFSLDVMVTNHYVVADVMQRAHFIITDGMAESYFLSNTLAQLTENTSRCKSHIYTHSTCTNLYFILVGCCCMRQATILLNDTIQSHEACACCK